jgi:16S rRNA (cytosine967-C5)-methyltransferase
MRGRLDFALGQVLDRPLHSLDAPLRNVLRLGAYQLLFLDRVAPASAVSSSVELARDVGIARAGGFANAVLRSLAGQVAENALRWPDREEDPEGWLVSMGSLPQWIAARWLAELGPDEACALAEASALAPPRSVRVSNGVDPEDVAARLLGRRGRFAPACVTDCRRDPVGDEGFARGEWTVQDEASQLVGLLVGATAGMTVVDCCAAPGAKTVQLAEAVGTAGEVIALDSNAQRLGLVRRGAERLHLRNVRTLERDATKSFDLRGRQSFPRILVDAPCTGLGVLRRNPDARWRVAPEDVPRMAEHQLALLDSAARYVEPGGALVYSVCTLTPEETTGVIQRFLAGHEEFAVGDARPWLPAAAASLVAPDGTLRTLPHRDGCDGFYAARLERS